MNILDNLPKMVRETARPYQLLGVRMIERFNGRCLLADDMGLGKTLQSIMYLLIRSDLRPALIVVPAVVKYKWLAEFKKWAPNEKVQVVEGRKEFKIEKDIVLINWDIIFYSKMVDNPKYDEKLIGSKKLVKKFYLREELRNVLFKIVIGDEVQVITSNKTGRTKAFKQACKHAPHIIAMSGTPMENKPIDFYNILKILRPIEFHNWLHFITRYCGAKKGFFGWKTGGASNLPELHNKVSGFMIRRLKEDVLKDLPDLTRIVVPLQITNRKEYDLADKNYLGWMRSVGESRTKAKRALQLTHIKTLEKLAIKGTIKSAIDWVGDYLETGNKLVVGCLHRDINHAIHKKFEKQSIQIMGGDNSTKRQKKIDRFQSDEKIRLAMCNIKAAGVGIDLFAANATCTIEILWNPATHAQFEARVHRIGQKADKVFAYYLVGVDTIMVGKAEWIDGKREYANQILNGRGSQDDESLIKLLEKAEQLED